MKETHLKCFEVSPLLRFLPGFRLFPHLSSNPLALTACPLGLSRACLSRVQLQCAELGALMTHRGGLWHPGVTGHTARDTVPPPSVSVRVFGALPLSPSVFLGARLQFKWK